MGEILKIHLETERMLLREFSNADVEHLVDLDSDPEVTRFVTGGVPPDRAAQQAFVESILAGYRAHPGFGFYVALEKPTKSFLGWFHFRPDRCVPEYMEIGYRLKQAAWGRGFATEGARALIEDGLGNGVRLVSGRAMKANHASVRVLQKLGLQMVEEYQEPRFPGEDKTAVLMRLE